MVKKVIKEEKEPLRLYLVYDENRSGGAAHDPNDRWTNHEPTYIDVKFHEFYRQPPTHRFFYDSIMVDEETFNADRAYLAVVRYSTGDTFGSTYGAFYIVGATATRKEATTMLEEALKGSGYKPWEGYFESLEGTEVHGLVVE